MATAGVSLDRRCRPESAVSRQWRDPMRCDWDPLDVDAGTLRVGNGVVVERRKKVRLVEG